MQVKIDLITGLLGSGKTTFIIRYVQKFLREGKRVCILANDYGAISVDRALLTEALGEACDVEMVTAGDWDCYRRRFRTKLISMGMLGYDRVIVEPSGIFDTDDFFNILNDSPIDRWYSLGNILCMVDAHIPERPDDTWKYLFTSEAANAGLLVVSRAQEIPGFPSVKTSEEICGSILSLLDEGSEKYRLNRIFRREDILAADWERLSDEDWRRILEAGHRRGDMVKLSTAEDGSYQTLFYYHISRPVQDVRSLVAGLFTNEKKYGRVIRVKGFFRAPGLNKPEGSSGLEKNDRCEDDHCRDDYCDDSSRADSGCSDGRCADGSRADSGCSDDSCADDGSEDSWYEINATAEHTEVKPTSFRKEVMIIVGEHLKGTEVGLAFGETRSVTYYDV